MKRLLACALAPALLAATASVAEASPSGICTPGSTRACASWDVTYNASTGIFSIFVQNLQGNPYTGDNTGGSALFGFIMRTTGGISGQGFIPGAAEGFTTTFGTIGPWYGVGQPVGLELQGGFTNTYIEGKDATFYRNDPNGGVWSTKPYLGTAAVRFDVGISGLTQSDITGFGVAFVDVNGNLLGCNLQGGDLSYADQGACIPTTATPEPMTMSLVGGGLAALAAARRRRKNALAGE